MNVRYFIRFIHGLVQILTLFQISLFVDLSNYVWKNITAVHRIKIGYNWHGSEGMKWFRKSIEFGIKRLAVKFSIEK